jgi:hypothetical protein
VAFPEHWVFDGTGLAQGETFADGFVGYETDASLFDLVQNVPCASGRDGTPLDFQVLATADLSSWDQFGQPGMATMGVYQRNGTVFTAASVGWTGGLGDAVSARVTLNVIDRLSKLRPADLWEQIGHAEAVTAMCGLHWFADMGPSSGRFLFATTSDDRLWRRAPLLVNVAWQDIGQANDIIAMAGLDARLYAISGDGRLWQRTAMPGAVWVEIQTPPPTAVALAAADGRLYVAASDGSLMSGAPAAAPVWQRVGSVSNVTAMAATGGRLMAISADGRLRSLTLAQPNGAWADVGPAPGMLTVAACDGRLFAADKDGRLWCRPAIMRAV